MSKVKIDRKETYYVECCIWLLYYRIDVKNGIRVVTRKNFIKYTVLKPTQVNGYKSIKVYGLTRLKELCKMTP